MIRHAEAEGNLFRRIHGQYESCITTNGMRQIRALQERFSGEKVDACYSSDLVRTRTTAQAVWVPKHLELRCDPRFREVALGVWEDQPFGKLEREEPEMMARFSRDPYHWHVDGSEDFLAYTTRFLAGLDEAARRHDGQTIAIFSHGCVLRGVQQRLFYPPEAIGELGHCDNTGVSLIEYEHGTYRKVYLNDNSHLTDQVSTLAQQNWWRKNAAAADRNLWFRPMEDDGRRFAAYRKDAWETVYGPERSFDGMAYFRDAKAETAGNPDALCDVMLHDRPVGVIQLAPRRYADQGIGYIPFLYLIPELRGKGLGIQLIGHAVSFYRRCGRAHLQLSVSPRNRAAQAFYKKFGFTSAGRRMGQYEDLIRMDYNMDLRQHIEHPVALEA